MSSSLSFYQLPPTAVARVPAVAQALGVSINTVWRWSRDLPNFPKPRKIGPRVTVWNVGEILNFAANSGAAK